MLNLLVNHLNQNNLLSKKNKNKNNFFLYANLFFFWEEWDPVDIYCVVIVVDHLASKYFFNINTISILIF